MMHPCEWVKRRGFTMRLELQAPQHPGTFPPWQAVVLPNNGQHRFRLATLNPDAARREFEPLLLPYVNDVQKLPIPSRTAVTPEDLPIPAGEPRA